MNRPHLWKTSTWSRRATNVGGMRGRLTLVPGLRRLWRDERTLQLGVDPSRALVIEMAQPGLARVLDLLDGTRTHHGVQKDAAAHHVTENTVTDLIETLREANLLTTSDELLPSTMTEPNRRRLAPEAGAIALTGTARAADAPLRLGSYGLPAADSGVATGHVRAGRVPRPAEALRRREAAWIQVIGAPRLAGPLAATLAASGVSHVDTVSAGRVGVPDLAVGGMVPADLDRPRGPAIADAIIRASPETDTRSMRDGAPTFVVHIGLGVPAELIAIRYARLELPHLLIEERDGAVLIGPLVPGAGRPCLNCVDLHRRDRDPAWPAVVAQLSTGAEAPFAVTMATTVVAAGLAAAQVLAFIDTGRAATIGASFEITGGMTPRRRAWSPHPRCDCATRKRNRAGVMRRSIAS